MHTRRVATPIALILYVSVQLIGPSGLQIRWITAGILLFVPSLLGIDYVERTDRVRDRAKWAVVVVPISCALVIALVTRDSNAVANYFLGGVAGITLSEVVGDRVTER